MAPEAVAIHELDHDAIEARHDELAALLSTALTASVSGRAFAVRAEVDATLRSAARFASHRTFVAERDGLLGVITGHGTTGPAFIRWIAVEPTMRRRGIGSALVTKFAEAVRHPTILGLVNADDPVATAFWTSRDWQPQVPGSRTWAYAIKRPDQEPR